MSKEIIKHKFNGSEWLNLVRDLLTMTFDTDKDYELIIRDYKEKRSLQANNYSWVLTDAKPVGNGRLGGVPATQWQIYRPSHEYNRSEFNVFLAGIVAEREEQGIETKTPDELARMISLVKDDEDE